MTLEANDSPVKCADTTDVVPVNAGDALSISTSTSTQNAVNIALRMNVAVEKQ